MASKQMWSTEVRHPGLNKYRRITGSNRYVVEQKARAQLATWNEMWRKKQEAEERRAAREAAARDKESKKAEAAARTEIAGSEVEKLRSTLASSLDSKHEIAWDTLLDHSEFPEEEPVAPSPKPIPREPHESDPEHTLRLGMVDKIVSSRRAKKESQRQSKFAEAHSAWVQTKERISSENDARLQAHDQKIQSWQDSKTEFLQMQEAANSRIIEMKTQYTHGDASAVSDYCDMVLANSQYPESFPQEWDIEFRPEPGMLLIEYKLPAPGLMPTAKAFKYVATRDTIEEQSLSTSFRNSLYDSVLYQIALRTIHEIFDADLIEAISSVNFNGWVRDIEPATGNEVDTCVMSVQASREDFSQINLANVDPKACFKSLKGVGSSKLHGIAAVPPIVSIDRTDTRFVDAREVVDSVDAATNLAAMDWQDFEHLIREVFEKEFVSAGGEVRVTQASKDGGVDAIAFDPDPIRGGKIVIQAKRYTNVVGVSAVRDLYGTTVNEGATKGILVTTSDYGPDAYAFAKGKPLALLNGANLLHLLQKHGHAARIDIREAKQLLDSA